MRLLETPQAGAYSALLVDYPWHFKTRSEKGQGKSPSRHYETDRLGRLRDLPVAQVAARDAWLFMWSTWPHLQEAQEVVRAWSDPGNPWTYSTGGSWAKQSSTGRRWAFGTGYLFRSASEPLLLYRRGSPTWHSTTERNLWVAPVRRHSQKPDEVHDMIRRATRGPRLELFARRPADGFDVWGMEAPR